MSDVIHPAQEMTDCDHRIKVLHKANSMSASKEGAMDATRRKLSRLLEAFDKESMKYLVFPTDDDTSDEEETFVTQKVLFLDYIHYFHLLIYHL